MRKNAIPIAIGVVALTTTAVALKLYSGKKKHRKKQEPQEPDDFAEEKRGIIGGITRIRKSKKGVSFDKDVIFSWNEDIEQADNDLQESKLVFDDFDGIATSDLDSSDFGSNIYDIDDGEFSESSEDIDSDNDVDVDDISPEDSLTAERLSKAIKQAKEVVEARKSAPVLVGDSGTSESDNVSVIDSLNELSNTAELELNNLFTAMTDGTDEEIESPSGVVYSSDDIATDLLSTAEFDKITRDDILGFDEIPNDDILAKL